MDGLNVNITCLEDEPGYWQADISTDGNHSQVYTSDGAEYIDTLPVEPDGTIIWIAGNDTYPGYFLVGYDTQNMIKIDTSQCGPAYGFPNEPQPEAIIVTPPPPTPPPTDMIIPVSNGAKVIPDIVILLAIIALVMRLVTRKILNATD